MYAFTIALYNAGVRHVDLALHMMSQPPWDTKMSLSNGKPYYILHYTYGCDYTHDGKFTPGTVFFFFLFIFERAQQKKNQHNRKKQKQNYAHNNQMNNNTTKNKQTTTRQVRRVAL